jgi:hypothetical protein
MGDVIRVDSTTVNSLISQVRSYDTAAADRLSLAASRAKSDADLANVYAAASSTLRRFEGVDAGGALARRAGFFGVSVDPRIAALIADVDRTGPEGRERGGDVIAMQKYITPGREDRVG